MVWGLGINLEYNDIKNFIDVLLIKINFVIFDVFL